MPRLVIGTVALLLALAACGGDPKADPSPTPSTPVSTAPSPTASAPVMPAEASANTKAGAIAFVRYYVELINHLQHYGDDVALRQVSLPTCRSCNSVVRAAKAIYDNGGHVEGGEWRITDIGASQPTATLWEVAIKGRLAASKVVDGPTSVPTAGSGGLANARFFLIFDQNWKVAQWHTG